MFRAFPARKIQAGPPPTRLDLGRAYHRELHTSPAFDFDLLVCWFTCLVDL